MATTFLWHDYETFGANARFDRPAQFAAIRTDEQLNEVGEPLMIYCKPARDYLPEPEACLITGITPQYCLEHGLPEYQFAKRIEQEFSTPDTIGVGYNSIRFDDEVTRFMFWRNLIDPYAREWQNNCSRWDILDVVRTAYALRPEGIEWPQHADGRPSFKLEDLSAANGLVHEAAHDALSDVRATIALARLLLNKQPKLFEFCMALRRKDRVAQELRLPVTQETARPFLHISGMFAPDRGCMAVMWPLATHPTNRNELLAWDLSFDPTDLVGMNAQEIRERMFTRSDSLPAGVTRLPVKGVHLNKSPIVISNLKTLSSEMAKHWQIDVQSALVNAAKARELPDMSAIWAQVYHREPPIESVDVDEDLYGGFVGDEDRRRLQRLRRLSGPELAFESTGFDDERLAQLVFRYRARNFPETLTAQEQQAWQQHCHARLLNEYGGSYKGLTIMQLQEKLDVLSMEREDPDNSRHVRDMEILEALYEYAESLVS